MNSTVQSSDRAFFERMLGPVMECSRCLVEHPKTGQLLVWVPAGKFTTDTGGGSPFEVELPGFHIGLHPVTNADVTRRTSSSVAGVESAPTHVGGYVGTVAVLPPVFHKWLAEGESGKLAAKPAAELRGLLREETPPPEQIAALGALRKQGRSPRRSSTRPNSARIEWCA